MDSFHIKGNNKFSGSVRVSGAKNAVLPLMTACLIYPGKYKLNNVPDLADTRTMIKLLKIIGCKTNYNNETLRTFELLNSSFSELLISGGHVSSFWTSNSDSMQNITHIVNVRDVKSPVQVNI